MSTNIIRDDLYALVWSEPLRKLAERFGLSDRGLAKLCARHDIPVPPRGWWARKAAGHRVRQAPLPSLTAGQAASITIHGQQRSQRAEPSNEPERDPASRIVVGPNARLTDPLIRDAAAALREARPSHDGICSTTRGCLDIRVSKAAAPRALRIFQALLLALKARGHAVEVKEGRTMVTVLGETVYVYLRERLKQTIRDLTPEEHRQRRAGLHVHPYQMVPKGELVFHAGKWSPDAVCGDRKRARLEESLNDLLEWFVEFAHGQKRLREAAQREAERHRQVAQEREAQRRRQREYEALLNRFDVLAAAYDKSERRRAFLARLREAVGDVEAGTPLAEWLDVVAQWTEVSDPLQAFRSRGQGLTLYHVGYRWVLDDIRKHGFSDSNLSEDSAPGVLLVDNRGVDEHADAIELVLPTSVVLPFEVTEPGYEPRRFVVPARLLSPAHAIIPPTSSVQPAGRGGTAT
jgi:hypothetical protein